MTFDLDSLSALDRRGYLVLEALTHAGRLSSSSHARPNAFIAIDGLTYWVKASAQQGLVAELVAGRLAARAGAGPTSRIIRVTPEATAANPEAAHLQGVVNGSQDVTNAINARDLGPLIGTGGFAPGAIDPASRARVVAFQTWLGVGDAQVLVGLTNGVVYSLDHGDAFGNTASDESPTIILTDIPGVSADVGRETVHIEAAVGRIEAVSDSDILEAVAGIPTGDPWRSPAARRLEIAEWLVRRRAQLRGVMMAWVRR